MRTFVLHDGDRYKLASHGGGTAYTLTRKMGSFLGEDWPQLEVFVQGDAALEMEAGWKSYEGRTGADGTTWDACLHYLWEHCGYGEIAEAEEA